MENFTAEKHSLDDAVKTPYRFDLRANPQWLNPFLEGRLFQLSDPIRTLAASTTICGDATVRNRAVVGGVNFGEECIFTGGLDIDRGSVIGAKSVFGFRVTIGTKSDVGVMAQIHEGVHIGSFTRVRPNSTISLGVTAGESVNIGCGARVGYGFQADKNLIVREFKGEPAIRPTCFDSVVCGACSVFHENPLGYFFGQHSRIGDSSRFYAPTTFTSNCHIGNYCRFFDTVTFQRPATIGAGVEFTKPVIVEEGLTLGPEVRFKGGLKWRGNDIVRFITMENVDGSGRQINILLTTEGIVKVQAGCYWNDHARFCRKAVREGKNIYAAVVRAAAAALLKEYDAAKFAEPTVAVQTGVSCSAGGKLMLV